MTTIESKEYQETRDRLKADPIVIAMAYGILGTNIQDLIHSNGAPKFNFMMAANVEYSRRAGHSANAHIGGVSEAILELLKQWKEEEDKPENYARLNHRPLSN